MGIIWRSAMPLLSTLAALVIIVHSAEENLERESRERRYDLRPRLLETRPSENEQPWRVIRVDTEEQRPAQGDPWDDSREPPPRRRMGRKRKRRPPAPIDDDDDKPLKMSTLPDEESQSLEMQRDETGSGKRRKNINTSRWEDPITADPERAIIRKRGQRRRKPSLDTWPRLSEFGDYHSNDKLRQEESETKTVADINFDDEDEPREHYGPRRFKDGFVRKRTKIRRPVLDDNDQERIEMRRPVPNSRYVIAQETGDQEDKPQAKKDKSLSEFSMEVMSPLETTSSEEKITHTGYEKLPDVYLDTDKPKKKPQPIDPITLRGILKRSNGTSLSEILQQHNLTLADLLSGHENAIAILNSEKLSQTNKESNNDKHTNNNDQSMDTNINENDNINIKTSESTQNNIISEYQAPHTNQNIDNDTIYDQGNTTNIIFANKDVEQTGFEKNKTTSADNNTEVESVAVKNDNHKPVALENRNSGTMVKRRFPPTIRRKQRMRPMVNNTFKSQINRDLIALSARRYIHHNRRNATKSREWKEMIPLMISVNTTENQKEKENILETTTSVAEETTIPDMDESTETIIDTDLTTGNNVSENETESSSTVVTEPTTITIEILATEMDVSVTERPKMSRTTNNPAGLRRQAFNNRLKKKRMKQRTSTTEAPQDDIMRNLLEMGDLVSSSEFIARTQLPKATSPDDHMETVTELEDFLTTETARKVNSMRSTMYPTTREIAKSSVATQAPLILSTEATAKIEIEEIFNDTRTSAKLSKILRERNMTLNELLEHRERGSSHVHLADIFHNASREPNPPEPFLSKSSIEPISKETYPLRAILEANSHEQTTKVTTIDPIYTNHVNIPVIMDFGNNVNENAENMGIMSLFNNFTKQTTSSDTEKSTLQQDSKGTPYKSTIITVNATDDEDASRESRMLTDDQDMISWNEIFSMIRKTQMNETNALGKLTNELPPPETYKKIILEEDIDGDGLIVLEDLQHLRDTDKKEETGSEDKIEFNSYEGTETPMEPGILSKAPSSAKSVTVATASIVGLAMILFLLTYAALKWKQQRAVGHKNTFGDERIPTPVFENRKIKKNCSSRSISPMLPTSNIYSMNTLESQTGKDSPEYMWDTLRKPFQ